MGGRPTPVIPSTAVQGLLTTGRVTWSDMPQPGPNHLKRPQQWPLPGALRAAFRAPMRLLPLSATLLLSLCGPAAAFAQEAAAGPGAPAPAAPEPPAAVAAPTAVTLSAPPAPATASSVAEIAALKQRLDELETQQAEATASAEDDDQRFKIYGFLDFGLKKSFPAKDPFFAALIERKLTFGSAASRSKTRSEAGHAQLR